MYYYIYDEYVQEKRFEREVALVENRLTDLGIQGKVARLALFRNPIEMIRDEVRKGVKTVIAVGNDKTLRRVIDAVAGTGATIGLIPIGKEDNQIATMLGVPQGALACDILSARIIEEMDLGTINAGRFLHRVVFEVDVGTKVVCDDQFSLYIPKQSLVFIRNLAQAEDGIAMAHPADGFLELVIKNPVKGWFGKKEWQTSFIKFKEIVVLCEKVMKADVDGEVFESAEFRVSCVPKQIRMITGRDRQFVSE
jgi:diacylglycerol kinase family enzyme